MESSKAEQFVLMQKYDLMHHILAMFKQIAGISIFDVLITPTLFSGTLQCIQGYLLSFFFEVSSYFYYVKILVIIKYFVLSHNQLL